jgi:hemerythrin
MAPLEPISFPELPLESMNAEHVEELRLLEQLGQALVERGVANGSGEALVERLALLAVHTREHFLHEEQVMRETAFPGYLAHKVEHDRVLAEMDGEARAFRATHDGDRLARYLVDVRRWYVSHTRTMDLPAARFAAERA